MANLKRLLDATNKIKDEDIVFDDDSPDLTTLDLSKDTVISFDELQKILSEDETKTRVTIRLKASTVQAFKSLGSGYQTKISKILDAVAENIKQSKHS